jgi:hypothetical protein
VTPPLTRLAAAPLAALSAAGRGATLVGPFFGTHAPENRRADRSGDTSPRWDEGGEVGLGGWLELQLDVGLGDRSPALDARQIPDGVAQRGQGAGCSVLSSRPMGAVGSASSRHASVLKKCTKRRPRRLVIDPLS